MATFRADPHPCSARAARGRPCSPRAAPSMRHHPRVDRLQVRMLDAVLAGDLARDQLRVHAQVDVRRAQPRAPPAGPARRRSTPRSCWCASPRKSASSADHASVIRVAQDARRRRPGQGCRGPRHRYGSAGACGPRQGSPACFWISPYDLHDCPRDVDATRAGLDAVEDRAAAPDAVGVGHDLEPLLVRVVARVDDEAVRVHDRRRTDVVRVRPEDRAGGGAGGAQDALAGVLVALALRRRLAPLLAVRRQRRR